MCQRTPGLHFRRGSKVRPRISRGAGLGGDQFGWGRVENKDHFIHHIINKVSVQHSSIPVGNEEHVRREMLNKKRD